MVENVHGLKHFSDHFVDLGNHYVIIGGVATNYFLSASDLIARRTKDIDLVVLANPNQTFADRLRGYITMGEYQIEADGNRRNYRFRNPKSVEFPKQIEIFSTAPLSIILREQQRIVPFVTSPGLESLSAILMDADYFGLIRSTNIIRDNMPLLTSDGLVPLKIRAYLDLDSRMKHGEPIDRADIKKHRNDVFRLCQTFGLEAFDITESIKNDIRRFLNHPEIVAIDATILSSIVEGGGFGPDDIRRILIEHFQL